MLLFFLLEIASLGCRGKFRTYLCKVGRQHQLVACLLTETEMSGFMELCSVSCQGGQHQSSLLELRSHMSRGTVFPTRLHVRPANTVRLKTSFGP